MHAGALLHGFRREMPAEVTRARLPAEEPEPMPVCDLQQSLDNLKLERDAIVLYDALASIEKDEHRAGAFRTIAGNERRHADIWAGKLRAQGADVPPPGRARGRVRVIILLARMFGTRAVSDLVQALEGDEEELYDSQGSPEVASIAADEREHAEIWRRSNRRGEVRAAGAPSAATVGAHPAGRVGGPSEWHRTASRAPCARSSSA